MKKASALKDALATLMQQLRRENAHVPDGVLEKIEEGVRTRFENEPSPRIAVIGDTGVGKSSTLNALFNAGREVGHTRATTTEEYGVRVSVGTVQADRGELIVFDMPGLNESIATHQQHLATYARVLADVDVALWILEAHHRPMEQVQSFLLNEFRQINSELVDRVVFALNKVDLVHPGQTAWHPLACLPSDEQQENIDARIKDVRRLVLEALPSWRGTVIGYSALQRYNLPQLFAVMLDAVAKKRQWVLVEHKALADYLEFVDDAFLPADRRRGRPAVKPTSDASHTAAMDTLINMSDDDFQRVVEERKRRSDAK